jgi:peptide/nickel transport system permease protein
VQFLYWLKELAHGNLGQSIFLQRPVTQALLERAEPTLFLTLFSIVIAR